MCSWLHLMAASHFWHAVGKMRSYMMLETMQRFTAQELRCTG